VRCLFNYIRYRVYDKATAEEITATVCERALTRLDQYDPNKGTLDTWMFSIARNVIRSHYRATQRSPQVLALDDLPELHSRGYSPEEAYEKMEVFQQIMHHLRRLPEIEQEVLALRFGAGLSNQEIAEITGLTANHVSVVRYRALWKIRLAVLSGQEV